MGDLAPAEETRVKAPIAVALDAPDAETAARWAQAVTPHVAVVKVGLELFCRTGPSIVQSVRGASGTGLFLDLKLHDIPNTVAGAARSVARLKPTLPHGARRRRGGHGARGRRGRARRRDRRGDRPDLRLTTRPSPTSASPGRRWTPSGGCRCSSVGAGAGRSSARRRRSPPSAPRSGPTSCSSRPACAPPARPRSDQARVATPEQALADGADLLVIGRPITGAADPGAAAAQIAAGLLRR